MNETDKVFKIGQITCPLTSTEVFKGELSLNNHKDSTVQLNESNILRRGTKLRNTDWAVGIVCYAGHDTLVH